MAGVGVCKREREYDGLSYLSPEGGVVGVVREHDD